jgi:hypothetical protein
MFATHMLLPILFLWSAPSLATQDSPSGQDAPPTTAADRARTMIEDEKRMFSARSHRPIAPRRIR